MPQSWSQSGLRWMWVAVVALVLDQATKLAVIANFQLFESIPLIPYLNLTYVHNTGAAFSFLAEAGGWQRWAFAGFALVVTIALTVMMRRQAHSLWRLNLSYALIIGGAIGNVIDRLAYGYVVDFIDFYVGAWHWPAFNIADSAICVGAVLMILDSLLDGRRPKEAS
ncbi:MULTISPECIES: signal peptidase II [Ferrimonas]|uniref:Lipoprotein signal peptidase n=1 Tax=Ferrimonas sediminum TaxID=718193 RepID=A0A1G8ZBF2_9GAMM|nr:MULTISPECIES: signal peptidase II [Ferrimonas]USD38212.1 signal peptidase II [Ferrimonas sp. SCSIO 43195]SDK12401.1 signal peptidase II Aspartic peptidase. MEROPS family A08 [Ferrimonas sediminum]